MKEKQFSLCEHLVAIGPWHIRLVGAEGVRYNGGARAALCFEAEPGRVWLGGWDLNVPLTEHHLKHACVRCVELYREQLKKDLQ